MFSNKKWLVVVNLLAIAGLILSACATPTPAAAPTQPPAPGATQPPAPAATEPPAPAATAPPAAPTSKDPTTFIEMTFADPETLDPAIDYETAGSSTLLNIYEGLVTFDGADPLKFVPQLAEAIPDPEPTDDGGVQYTWTILDGVKFHNGDPLTAEDVAFSFWRSMLVGDNAVAPSFLVLEAFLDIDDATQLVAEDGSLVSDPDGLKAADPAKLAAACETVKAAVTFDNDARTVTMKLVHPWGPFLPTLAGGSWAFVTDKKWVAENGDWDGDCATWQNFYSIPSESGALRDKTNGTGPYMLDHWTPGEELVLVANPGYRKGPAKITRVVKQIVNEFGTRFAALQAGDADENELGSTADRPQMDTLVRDDCDLNTGECKPYEPANPNGILRRYVGFPSVLQTHIGMNYKVTEGSPFIGSGKLDGEGVPPDFFSDIHIRKAFAYCFDYDTYIQDVYLGEGQASPALVLPGQPGSEVSTRYEYDLDKCAEEFQASTLQSEDGQSVWDVGIYLQFGYNTGNTARQTLAEILAASLAQVNDKFLLVPVAIPWPSFLRAQRDRTLAISTAGWQEDIHDPHNWYVPYLTGTYASRNNVPDDLKAKYQDLINQGVLETDQAKRAEIYAQLNQLVQDDVTFILGTFREDRRYEPLYLHGWWEGINRNTMIFGQGLYYYELSKD